MMGRLVLLAALVLGLGGCGVTAVVGAAATVVGAGVEVAGSAVSATIDVVGSGLSGAIDMATDNDDDDSGAVGKAARGLVEDAEPSSANASSEPTKKPGEDDEPETVETVWDLAE